MLKRTYKIGEMPDCKVFVQMAKSNELSEMTAVVPEVHFHMEDHKTKTCILSVKPVALSIFQADLEAVVIQATEDGKMAYMVLEDLAYNQEASEKDTDPHATLSEVIYSVEKHQPWETGEKVVRKDNKWVFSTKEVMSSGISKEEVNRLLADDYIRNKGLDFSLDYANFDKLAAEKTLAKAVQFLNDRNQAVEDVQSVLDLVYVLFKALGWIAGKM